MRKRLGLTSLLLLAFETRAFQVIAPSPTTFARIQATATAPLQQQQQHRHPHQQQLLRLYAKKRKRGKLGDVDISSNVVESRQERTTPSKAAATKAKASSKPKSKPASKGQQAVVSPALAEWASVASESTVSATTTTPTAAASEENDDAAPAVDTTFAPFETETEQTTASTTKKRKTSVSSPRRAKQSARIQQEREREAIVARIVNNINTVLDDSSSSNNKLENIVAAIRPLIKCPSANLRQLTKRNSASYRLAWVGSDDALCHIGTGLHKVPLARMQEVFLVLDKGRIEILEVIRILGPFPNVRNTLQGDGNTNKVSTSSSSSSSSSSSPSDDVTEWTIVYDSMIDGTGKELLAGTENNIRRVRLHVYFCNDDAILAVVPPDSETNAGDAVTAAIGDDPLRDNGVNALLFVREDELEAKLDQLRVS